MGEWFLLAMIILWGVFMFVTSEKRDTVLSVKWSDCEELHYYDNALPFNDYMKECMNK